MPASENRLSVALADRYRIERELGQGGMATVYLAEDLKHKRQVAIKVLKPELAAVLGAERFVQEIATTAALQHPHILPLFDSGEADGFLYYVMPFIDGETLRAKLDRETQLGVAEAVKITTDVADALQYAHEHGVIHRDIKPENILLQNGRPMVADFGIALAVSAAAGGRMTETGLSLGTPHYMSPEQATAEKEITARSDQYSLASVLYEMLTGNPPHMGSSAQQIIMKIITEAPADVTAVRKSVPAHVAAAVARALEKLPADRFASTQLFAEALANAAFTPPVRGSAGTPSASAGRGWLVPLLAMIALGTTALATWGLTRSTPTTGVSRFNVVLSDTRFENTLANSTQTFIDHRMAIAPDGSAIVFTDSTAEATELRVKQRGERGSTPLPGTANGHAPVFSPDGEWIAYFTEDGRIRKLPAAGGGSIDIVKDANRAAFSHAWLEDGTIVYADDVGGLSRVPSAGGPSRQLVTSAGLGGRSIATLWPLPRSRGVLVTTCAGNCISSPIVAAFDLQADTLIDLVPEALGAWYVPSGHLLYTTFDGGLYAVGFDVGTLATTSGAVSVIADVSPTEFTVSAAGTVLYVAGAGATAKAELVWVSRDGRTESVDSTWREDFMYPSLSPDGRAMAVSTTDENTQLWVRRADGARQKLTLSGSSNWRPNWSADGRVIRFSGLPADGATEIAARDILEVPADGSGSPRVVIDAEVGVWEVENSRDGRWMVFRTEKPGEIETGIWARRLDADTSTIPIREAPDLLRQIAISPDSRWLAYSSDESGRQELYVTSFPDATVKRLVSQGGGLEPRWSASGRELFFKSGGSLMVVDIADGPTLAPSVPRALFSVETYRGAQNRQQYDVAPDGQRFLMIRPLDDGVQRTMVYAENWFEELAQKVPR